MPQPTLSKADRRELRGLLRASLNVLDGHIKNPEIGDGLRAAYTKHRIKTAKLLAKLIG